MSLRDEGAQEWTDLPQSQKLFVTQLKEVSDLRRLRDPQTRMPVMVDKWIPTRREMLSDGTLAGGMV